VVIGIVERDHTQGTVNCTLLFIGRLVPSQWPSQQQRSVADRRHCEFAWLLSPDRGPRKAIVQIAEANPKLAVPKHLFYLLLEPQGPRSLRLILENLVRWPGADYRSRLALARASRALSRWSLSRSILRKPASAKAPRRYRRTASSRYRRAIAHGRDPWRQRKRLLGMLETGPPGIYVAALERHLDDRRQLAEG
jgi:hypothetical protein